jgi:hypothetical protein
MKITKSIPVPLLTLVLALTLAACGGSSDNNRSSGSDNSGQDAYDAGSALDEATDKAIEDLDEAADKAIAGLDAFADKLLSSGGEAGAAAGRAQIDALLTAGETLMKQLTALNKKGSVDELFTYQDQLTGFLTKLRELEQNSAWTDADARRAAQLDSQLEELPRELWY